MRRSKGGKKKKEAGVGDPKEKRLYIAQGGTEAQKRRKRSPFVFDRPPAPSVTAQHSVQSCTDSGT